MTTGPDFSEEEMVKLEATMRRKLLLSGKSNRGATVALSDEDLKIAKKLMGGDNAARLASAKVNGRRFRPLPVNVKFEYFRVPGAYCSWRINKLTNGRPEEYASCNTDEDLRREVRRLTEQGFTVSHLALESDREAARQQARLRAASPQRTFVDKTARSYRHDILRALKDFRL